MDMAVAITKDNFTSTVAQGVSLLDFWAPWCGPCKMQLPIVEELAGELQGKATIAKVNVDEEPELASQFGVMSIPTLILFKDGQPVDKLVGLQSKQALLSKIQSQM
jgi:thioredoxin 1